MWRLTEFRVDHLLGCAEAAVQVREPVVMLTGQKGSGKSSVLAAISATITGDALWPDGKKMSRDDLKNPAWGNGWGAVVLGDGEGAEFAIGREFKSSITVNLDGEKCRTLGEAEQRITATLGVPPEQLLWLMGGDPLIAAKPLDQAGILANTLGVDLGFEGLIGRLNGHADLGRAVLSKLTALSGWELLSRAQGLAEEERLQANRRLEDARGRAQAAQTAMDDALRAARAGDLSVLQRKRDALQATIADAQERGQRLRDRRLERAEKLAARERAQAELDRAEAQVASLREQVAGADEARAAREAEREKLRGMIEEAKKQLAAATTEFDEAKLAAQAAREVAEEAGRAFENAWNEATTLRAKLPRLLSCPGCSMQVVLVDDVLVARSDLPAGTPTETEVAAAEAAQVAADEALTAAKQSAEAAEAVAREKGMAVQSASVRVRETEAGLLAYPSLPAASDLQARLEAAVRASDEATAALDAQDAEIPDEVSEADLTAVDEVLREAQEALRALEGVTARVTACDEALGAVEEAEGRWSALDGLVSRLREITREVAVQIAAPVADSLGAMLGEEIVFDEEVGLGAKRPLPGGKSYVHPLSKLSGGEKLQARAALQGVLAVALGFGLAVVDEFGALDEASARATLAIMRRIAREHGLVWVVASAQTPPPGLEGVQVVEMEGGFQLGAVVDLAASAK